MADYYKGQIVDVSSICAKANYKFSFLLPGNDDDERCFMSIDGLFNYISKDAHKKAYNYFKAWINNKDKNAKNKLDILIERYYKLDHKITGQDIIYEKVYDKDNNIYAKELISGRIFPISNDYSKCDITVYKDEPKYQKVFLDKERNKVYVIDKPTKIFNILSDDNINLTSSTYNELYQATEEGYKKSICIGKEELNICLRLRIPVDFLVEVVPIINKSSNQRIEYTIFNEVVATELEVNEYLNEFNGVFKNRRRNNYIKEMTRKSSSNYLGNNIIYSSSKIIKEKEKEELLIKEMQELEYMLTKLKTISENDYKIINDEYQSILKQEDDDLTLNPLVLSTIVSLQNKAKLAYLCNGGSSKQINDYLEKQVELYLDNCKNNTDTKTKITISDIDDITEKVLKAKFNYSYKEKNDILRHIALLYFFEVYENRDTVTTKELANSYITNNIKRIITIISVLLDEGIIKDIDSDMFVVDNLEKLIDLIKGIEIKITENELIKKIQL